MRYAPVRWREDTGWELRCDRCASQGKEAYWPLSFEFWTPGRMKACNACSREMAATRKRHRYHTDPEYRARKVAINRRNRGDQRVPDALRWQAFKERMAADPELLARYRERTRAATAEYRRRIRAAKWAAERGEDAA